jgi:hypothetical protein
MEKALDHVYDSLQPILEEKGFEGFRETMDLGPAVDGERSFAALAQAASELRAELRQLEQRSPDADTQSNLAALEARAVDLSAEISNATIARAERIAKIQKRLSAIYPPDTDPTALHDRSCALDVLLRVQQAAEDNAKKYQAIEHELFRVLGPEWSTALRQADTNQILKAFQVFTTLHVLETDHDFEIPYPIEGETEWVPDPFSAFGRIAKPDHLHSTPDARKNESQKLHLLAQELRITGIEKGIPDIVAFFGERRVIPEEVRTHRSAIRAQQRIAIEPPKKSDE